MQELIAYHGTKRKNVENILKNGFKESISTEKRNHWLGRGIYFFDDLYYAMEWNYCNIEKCKSIKSELFSRTAIIIARIDFENFNVLDLNSGLGYVCYQKIIKILYSYCSKEEAEELIKGNDIKTIRIIEKIEEKMGIKLISDFDVVCALYPKNIFSKKIKNNSDFFVGVQRQICVKNQQAIVNKTTYNYEQPEIKEIYNLILKNRRKIDDK